MEPISNQPKKWFRSWIALHQEINPHRGWPRYEAPGFAKVYRGWVRAFRLRGVTLELATAASERMQTEETLYPEKHLARVLKLAQAIERDRAAEEQARSREARRRKERAVAEMHDHLRLAWAEVPEEFKAPYRAEVRAEFPAMARLPRWIDLLARLRWAEESRPAETAPALT